jgi:hypothetical protein
VAYEAVRPIQESGRSSIPFGIVYPPMPNRLHLAPTSISRGTIASREPSP